MRNLLTFSFIFFSVFLEAKTIYLVPFPHTDPNVLFYGQYSNGSPTPTCENEENNPYVRLREHLEKEGHILKFTTEANEIKESDYVISFSNINSKLLKNLSRIQRKQCFLIILEPPVIKPSLYKKKLEKTFGKIFTMFDHQINNDPYIKLHFPQARQKMIEVKPVFSQKKLCTMIVGKSHSNHSNSLYYQRKRVVNFFRKNHSDDFDLYGHAGTWSNENNYKGTIEHKWPVLKNYKFSFCYENMGNQNGYVTEKIFDSLVAGCVPIYLGADNITDYVPANCFIDKRNFRDMNSLYQFLDSMDEETYNTYIKAIEDYSASPLAQKFSVENFIHTIESQMN